MPTVRFTDNIQRHVECPTRVVEGARVRDVLEAYFAARPWISEWIWGNSKGGAT